MNNFDIEFIQDMIKSVSESPEREQAQDWQDIIDQMNYNMTNSPSMAHEQEIEVRDIFISIAKEAKYFA